MERSRGSDRHMADFDDLGSLDDLDSLDDLGDLEEISFDDPPVQAAQPAQPVAAQPVAAQPVAAQPAAAQPVAAQPALSGLGAMIQDLISKRNYQQVIQIAETQKQAIEREPQVQAMVDMARTRLQQESYLLSYVEAAQQALAAGQGAQAQQFLGKAREIDPQHPALLQAVQALQGAAAQPVAAQPAAPQPVAAQPAAPQPVATQPAAPQPVAAQPIAPVAAAPAQPSDDLLSFDDQAPLTFEDDDFGNDLQVDALDLEPAAAEPVAAQPAAEAPGAALEEDPLTFEGEGMMPDEGGFDGAEDAESAERIQQLLAEGQTQFEQGQFQSAIDVWSRIFLIDIDHAEASRRIEEARGKKDELERQAEEIFNSALDQIEAQQLEEAKASLARVLEFQPTHPAATEYLAQLQAGEVPVINRADFETPSSAVDLLDDGGLGDLQAATLSDDGQSMEAAVARDRVVVVKRTDRRLLGLAAGVGILLIGGIGFLVMKWDDIFRNTDQAAQQQPVRKNDPIRTANTMFDGGNIENAILLLEKVSPDDENYQEAQALIAQWKAMVETPADAEPAGPSEEMMQRRELLLRAARDAYGLSAFIRARKYFDNAGKILPLETEDLALRRECDYKLEPIAEYLEGFREAEYERILPGLWRKLEEEPESPDLKMLIIDSYYNLALTDLQRGNPAGAAAKLTEALEVAPESEELKRLKLFADSYSSKSPDLLYRIFVKYLPARA